MSISSWHNACVGYINGSQALANYQQTRRAQLVHGRRMLPAMASKAGTLHGNLHAQHLGKRCFDLVHDGFQVCVDTS